MNIILGSAQFGSDYGINNKFGKVSDWDLKQILKEAENNSLYTIDTAVDYGDSEERLGKHDLNKFKIISKLPSTLNINPDDIPNWINKVANNSLNKLNIKKLEALLLHRPQEILGDNGNLIIKGLNDLKENNLVDKIGVSIYNPSEIQPLFKKYKFQIVQTPLNILDRRIIESGWLKKLKSNNIEVHARSVFLQGLLLMELNKLNNDFFKDNKFLLSWFNWLRENNLSSYDISLKFIKSNKLIDKFLIGVDNYSQFQELIRTYLSKGDEIQIPNFKCDDQILLNPSRWPKK